MSVMVMAVMGMFHSIWPVGMLLVLKFADWLRLLLLGASMVRMKMHVSMDVVGKLFAMMSFSTA